jgi:hypothetical protein
MKAILAALSVLLILSGCSAAKKAAREQEALQVYAVRYPDNFKQLAAIITPCNIGKAKSDTTTTVDTVIIKGETITKTETRHDTVFTTTTIKEAGKNIVKKLAIHDTVTDNRALEALKASNRITEDKLLLATKSFTEADSKASKFKLWFWLLVGAVSIYIIYSVYTFISGGALKSFFK